MPRKKIFPELTVEDRFDEQIVEAIWNTTIQMRERIARRYEAGQISNLIDIPGIHREAVLIASLVDADSPLVFRGYRLRAKRLYGLLKVLGLSYPQTSHSSVDKTTKSVDNLSKPVDKSVEKSVEKSTHPVDKLSTIYESGGFEENFSTTCGKVVSLSTGPVDNFPIDLQSIYPLFKDSHQDLIPTDLSTLSTGPTTTTDSTHI